MSKIIRKLVASAIILSILLVMMVAVSYAWTSLSTSPEVSGLQISIGGRDTIMIAPNMSVTVDGKVYNYPGRFDTNLNFGNYQEYGYLNKLQGLTPVSTADGIHWVMPTYYAPYDEEVVSGAAQAGQLKPISEFRLDTSLEYANIQDTERARLGHYVYLDFWIVSPSADYDIRLASGDESSGSFLIELPAAKEVDTDGDGEKDGYELVESLGMIAATARVGFLVDHNTVRDDSMIYYQRSQFYSNQYAKLRGSYHNSGENISYSSDSLFTIYEPNGDLHPMGEDGTYSVTNPIGWNGELYYADVRENLTVQMRNKWTSAKNGDSYIGQIFKTVTRGKSYDSATDAEKEFYTENLQGHFLSYVDQGSFIKNTSSLYEKMTEEGVVSKNDLDAIEISGATEDSCIAHLEKNIPQRVRMFIWLEGQDTDCLISEVRDISFALNIELAGSDYVKNEKEEDIQ